MKVIIAIDDSPYSAQVVQELTKRQWLPDVQFKVLQVIEPAIWEALKTKDGGEARSSRELAAQRLCAQVRQSLEASIPTATVHCEIRKGDARVEIIDAAGDWSADKLILGAHGKELCSHSLLGSVSRAVTAHAPCTVEIVRPQALAQAMRETGCSRK